MWDVVFDMSFCTRPSSIYELVHVSVKRSRKTVQPVEKVQVISSFYPWSTKCERTMAVDGKIYSSIEVFFNRLGRFWDKIIVVIGK